MDEKEEVCQKRVKWEVLRQLENHMPKFDYLALWKDRIKLVNVELEERMFYLRTFQDRANLERIEPPTNEAIKMYLKVDKWTPQEQKEYILPKRGFRPLGRNWLSYRGWREVEEREERAKITMSSYSPPPSPRTPNREQRPDKLVRR